MGKAQSLPPVADIQRLSKELLADPLSNVNNIVSILKYLSAEQPKVRHLWEASCCQRPLVKALQTRCGRLQETVVAAVRCLKVFFLDAYERGDLLPAAKVWSVLAHQDLSHAPMPIISQDVEAQHCDTGERC